MDRLEERHMTQQELASELGLSRQQINRYVLNKRTMSIHTAAAISRKLNCTIDDLYEITVSKE